MAVPVPVSASRSFDVKAAPEEVYALLSNVPEAIRHFPKVERLEDLGGGKYRRVMEKTGVGKASIQIEYDSQYSFDPANRTVSWAPVPGAGNGQVGGTWTIQPRPDGGSHLELSTSGELDLPVSKMLAGAVKGPVAKEFEHTMDTYVQNLTQAFGGPA